MSYKIEQRDGLEVFANDSGWVIIKQDSDLGGEAVVAVHPEDVPALITFLTKAAAEASDIRIDLAEESSSDIP